MSRARSRSPHRRIPDDNDDILFETGFESSEDDDDDEDVVGNAHDLSHGDLGTRGSQGFQSEKAHLGCFEWQRQTSDWYELPERRRDLGVTRRASSHEDSMGDHATYFARAVEESHQVFEASLSIQPRDVHKVNQHGQTQWVLNEKPKKRAEVQFRRLSEEDKMHFLHAMKSEVSSYLEHEAVEIARRHGIPAERVLGMRFVLTWKTVEDDHGAIVGQKPKARLIIKGFQDPDLLHLKRDSPTLATQNRNLILACAAHHKWRISIGDIKTAFLNGDKTEVEREIFADPPEEVRQMMGMKPHEVWRILKAVYGLLHAPRAWADKLSKELKAHGWIQSKLEPCVFRLYDSQKQLVGLIGTHVDDLVCCGSGELYKQKIHELRESFPFGSWREVSHEPTKFCGCEIVQHADHSVELNQERYAEGINEIPLTRERREQDQDPATESECSQLRAALGALAWRATQTAPWLCASVSYLQGCQKKAKVADLIDTNKLIRTQRQYSQMTLKFTSRLQNPVLVTFHDASWACRRDGSSQGGVLTLLADRCILEGKPSAYSVLAWQSRKLPRVCRSSTSAEVQMGSHAIDTHEFVKQILMEWYNRESIPAQKMDEVLSRTQSLLVTDSKNVYDSVIRIESSGLQLEERRLALEVLSIRERVKLAGVDCRWVDGGQQLADGLSKPFTIDSLITSLNRGTLSIVFDDKFVSAKRKKALQRSAVRNVQDSQIGVSSKENLHRC